MTNPVVQTDIAEILGQINAKLEVGQAEIKGDIKAIDERLSGQKEASNTKSDQLEKRISNSRVFQSHYWRKLGCQYFRRYC